MKIDKLSSRNLFHLSQWSILVLIFAGLLLAAACGGGGGGGGGSTPRAAFAGSGTALAANRVIMTGATVTDSQVRVDIKIGGPTTSSDIHAFAFDILLGNPSIVSLDHFSPGEAIPGTEGTAKETLATQEGNRVVVSVTKLGVPGVGVSGTSANVISLFFNVTGQGRCSLTFANSQPDNKPPSALDSGGSQIPSISFDSASATISK